MFSFFAEIDTLENTRDLTGVPSLMEGIFCAIIGIGM